MRQSIAISAAATLLLGGCGELFGDLVEQPPAAVVNMIYNMPPDKNLMRLPAHFPGATMMVATSPQGVVWTYKLNGVEACRFVARVKEETSTSAVVWTESEDISDDGEDFLCDAVNIAGEESVAATLEGRPVDREAMRERLAAAMTRNFGSIQRTIGKEIQANAPESKECWEESNAKARQNCRTREFNRDHERQNQGITPE